MKLNHFTDNGGLPVLSDSDVFMQCVCNASTHTHGHTYVIYALCHTKNKRRNHVEEYVQRNKRYVTYWSRWSNLTPGTLHLDLCHWCRSCSSYL